MPMILSSCSKVGTASSFTFKPRECNNVAHGVAKFHLYENENMLCIEHRPEWLMKLVKIDSNSGNTSSKFMNGYFC